jgi:hypothetical protein
VNPATFQWLTLLLAILITAAILVLDALLYATLGANATFSYAFDAIYRRWPIVAAMLFLWIGILIGHLLPAKA